ncbi:MAG: hypothetical protein QF886_13525, partial [Planctomycetota bacterium]|nr:hypothetical protein [Planctomycetota bacterium]
KLHLICQRKKGRDAHFTAILEPCRGTPVIQKVILEQNLPHDRRLVVSLANGEELRVRITDGEFSVERK